ncbi:hypothetical protein CBD41_06440 [bacterium TMED181]|nr:MAG: hypothetical protein CBD41_06440 [bacterium TMED181]
MNFAQLETLPMVRLIRQPIALLLTVILQLLLTGHSTENLFAAAGSGEFLNSTVSSQAIARQFVKGGDMSACFNPAGGWSVVDGVVTGTGRNSFLIADHEIGKGNFDIELNLTLTQTDANYAAFELGQGAIILGGDEGKLIFRGFPKSNTRQVITDLSSVVQSGKPFTLTVRRRNQKIQVFIEGKRLHQVEGIRQDIGEIGVLAGHGTVQIHRFRASGNLREGRRTIRLNHEALAALKQDDRVTLSLEAGIDFLLSESQADPEGILEGSHPEAIPGARALECYALITAGVDRDHPVLRKHFKVIEDSIPAAERMYDVSCWVFALDAAITQTEQDALMEAGVDSLPPSVLSKLARNHRNNLKDAAEILLKGQNETGGWRYQSTSTDADTSVTQFAVLALAVMARRGISIEPEVWEGVSRYILSCQDKDGPTVKPEITLAPPISEPEESGSGKSSRKDGTGVKEKPKVMPPLTGEEFLEAQQRGFRYVSSGDSGNWNMSCAGVSSLMVAYDYGAEKFSPEFRKTLRDSIRDGVAWLIDRWVPTDSCYGMYSLEKVGDLGGIEKFGTHDWYQVISEHLLSRQSSEGSWINMGNYAGQSSRVDTAFALLILKRASAMLTRSATSFVIFSGGGSATESVQSEDWALLANSGRSIHLPTLVRQLRLRPKAKLLKIFEEVVLTMPAYERPKMLRYLSLIEERMTSRGALKRLEKIAELIRPGGFESAAERDEWGQAWLTVQEILRREKSKSSSDTEEGANPPVHYEDGQHEKYLINLARKAGEKDDETMREVAIRAAIQLGCDSVVELLIEDLSASSEHMRVLAYGGIRAILADSPPDYDPQAHPENSKADATRVAAWARSRLR